MLSTWILAVCFSADTSLTADVIMQRVIENQTRAQEARKQWVYTQEVFARSTQRNKTLMREETRTFRVLPSEKSTKRELLAVTGQRRVKNKLERYEGALSGKDDDSIVVFLQQVQRTRTLPFIVTANHASEAESKEDGYDDWLRARLERTINMLDSGEMKTHSLEEVQTYLQVERTKRREQRALK